MRVALVAPYPRTEDAHGEESLGGVASYTRNLVDGLRAHADVRVLALHDEPMAPRDDEGVQVDETRRDPATLARALRRLAKDPRTDVIHAQFEQHLYGGVLANLRLPLALARARRHKPVVLTLHQVPDLEGVDAAFLGENGFPPFAGPARAYLRTQMRRLAHSTDLVLVHESRLRDRLVHQYGIATARVRVVPHGIETPRSPPARDKARAELGLEGHTVFLYFGFVSGYKGVDLLAEAAARIPPARRERMTVIVAGKAPGRKLAQPSFRQAHEKLEARLAGLAPFVERKGFLSHADVMRHVVAADALVLPYTQVFGASGPASIAHGLGTPVLGSDAFEGMGFPDEALFARDADALRDKLVSFMEDPGLQARLRAHAASKAETASWAAIGEHTMECYHEAMRRRSA